MKFRNAENVAALLVLNLKTYSDEKEKDLKRVLIGASNLAELFGYTNNYIEPEKLKELEFHLRQRGYLFFVFESGIYGMLRISTLANWPRIAMSRIEAALDLPLEDIESLINADSNDQGVPLDKENDLYPNTWSFDRIQQYFFKHLTDLDISAYTTRQAACLVQRHMRKHNIVPAKG
ncbi:hypothetical protein JA13_303 [Dickeya phage vB_DsoM_JA13]|uniref:Uncharacterized protein n=1 Tax=Dickeya phage vB_DsoM_JA13 TaxID=2283030 RepID=A0A384ZWU4_9CAUD|nr:hypothetical protein JA13_303 [Dickeya phage vB_DsoM_JA13]